LSSDILLNLPVVALILPLLGFLGYLWYGRWLSEKQAGTLATSWVVVSFILSVVLFLQISSSGTAVQIHLFDWINADKFQVPLALQVDQLSVIMMLLITGVGSLIHIYSIGYMHGDAGFKRFFSYLNLFIFFMLVLVMANNYVLMFAGWEGVGLCSYLLIGFWYKNHEYNAAANKAFIMNRIGDLCLLFGLFMIFSQFGSFVYSDINLQATNNVAIDATVMTAITLLLFAGATGKSAQLPLYTWLPDAMAGPTPVSALIHAATMVTAGIYLIIRSNVLFVLAPFTNDIIMIVGLTTAIFAGLIAFKQNDIKKVLAYSTVSQLGLMFFALGLGAYGAAFFHLLTHAFFKALLFLGAGSVIHGLSGEQDIRNMGGLKKYMKSTHIVFLIGVLAIIALPPFAGFFSKDNILTAAFIKSPLLWVLALISGLLTVFYMLRLYFVVFQGKERMDAEVASHIHESSKVMLFPLFVLAILSVFGGLINVPELFHGTKWLEHFITPIVSMSDVHLDHSTEWILLGISLAAILAVGYIAYHKYVRTSIVPESDIKTAEMPLGRLLKEKFYVDELYNAIIVKPLFSISKLVMSFFEEKVIHQITNGSGQLTLFLSGEIRKTQNGFISYYLFAMALGVLGILTIFIILS
jgi:NADH-quinone oxidoreductase subunit L